MGRKDPEGGQGTIMSKRSCTRPLPMMFTVVVILFVFTSYLSIISVPMMESSDLKTRDVGFTYTAVLSLLFALMFVSFLRVSTTDAGTIPDWFQDTISERSKSKDLKIVEKKSDGSRRRCNKCLLFKPDRTHHCKICGRCNLKMDHHCPWINNCVGYTNYKFFILFISYALACSIFVFVTTLTLIPSFDSATPLTTVFIVVLICVLTGALSAVLFAFVGFHYYLLCQNYTTIEFLEKRGCCNPAQGHVNHFDLGAWENVKRGLGYNPLLWPIPARVCMIDQHEGTQFDTNGAISPKSV
eukprot:c1965_g1_i1.p1 GENE.c1965_g1_i1~~c1965_g1_i1.p1  ORF type:complete len:298 (+),score=27.03 c1965_g1_i1:1-894(+)